MAKKVAAIKSVYAKGTEAIKSADTNASLIASACGEIHPAFGVAKQC